MREEFEERLFASCPTEIKEPFFWRWTDEARETFELYRNFLIERAYALGVEDSKLEIYQERWDAQDPDAEKRLVNETIDLCIDRLSRLTEKKEEASGV